MPTDKNTDRRSVLKWAALGAAALAGTVAAGIAGERQLARRGGQAESQRLVMAGHAWRVVGLSRGQLPAPGTQLAITGEVNGDYGRMQGEFYASSVYMGAGKSAAGYAETHQFNLRDGSLVGSGTWFVDGRSSFAILGGTGRYAGATGTYEAIQRPIEFGGDGTADFTFDLMLPGGATNGSR